MTKSELLQTAKPILFNTDMVRAILEGRKTVTRRVVKKEKADAVLNSPARKGNPDIPDRKFIKCLVNSPYQKGDILYVRETYCPNYFSIETQYGNRHGYKAEYDDAILSSYITAPKWKPSIHMPKEAARIFLKVTDVRVERLQDIIDEQAIREGATGVKYDVNTGQEQSAALDWFPIIWNSTIKKQDLDLYGWYANPWVWVIEFERIL